MKSQLRLFFVLVTILLLAACKDEQLQEEKKKLLAENNRLIKELSLEKARFDSLKNSFSILEKQAVALNSAKDTLQLKMEKQAKLEILRKKADEKPLELATITVQNESDKAQVLKVKSPFLKSEARYISFKGTAINNAAKVQKKLVGRLLSVYRLGTLVQQMKNTSGTFTSDDGSNKVFTHSWDIQSDKETFALDKGIGDKSRGIFQSGEWTLELWFEPKGKSKAYKLTEGKFQIK
jgi:hypothetical protein